MATSSAQATQVVRKQTNSSKIVGTLLILGSTVGCLVGAGAESLGLVAVSLLGAFVGFVLFIIGRFRD